MSAESEQSPLPAVNLSDERKVSAPLKFWIALLAATATALLALGDMRSDIKGAISQTADHEIRLRAAEKTSADTANDVRWIRQYMEAQDRRRNP